MVIGCGIALYCFNTKKSPLFFSFFFFLIKNKWRRWDSSLRLYDEPSKFLPAKLTKKLFDNSKSIGSRKVIQMPQEVQHQKTKWNVSFKKIKTLCSETIFPTSHTDLGVHKYGLQFLVVAEAMGVHYFS